MKLEYGKHYSEVDYPIGILDYEALAIGIFAGYKVCKVYDLHWSYGLLVFFVAAVTFWALIQVKFIRLILIWGLTLIIGFLTYYMVRDSVDNFMGIVTGSLIGALIYYKHTNDYKVYLYYQHLKERMKEDEEKDSKALELRRAFENK
ncbi:hypothetical protein FHS57_005904 [Runella defluvii]|uniref:Uncharacterized protein n=1 Tax=Runella defluvii TaxID=370973 RepID=A0A7W6ETI1_9BACT|nr:hypothetical protein [Runella defluvii]MBB3841875.1 hypothetical protein [Runella defluvii]